MTNFWESLSEDLEVSQGKAVADASKKAGVKHLIFSSLLNITEASGGKLRHVKHFDSKAKIEQHIRDIGVPATFYLPGAFMSNYFQIITKSDDGTYTLAVPVTIDSTLVPLIDIQSDTGTYLKMAHTFTLLISKCRQVHQRHSQNVSPRKRQEDCRGGQVRHTKGYDGRVFKSHRTTCPGHSH